MGVASPPLTFDMASPLKRLWFGQSDTSWKATEGLKLRALTFNILADSLASGAPDRVLFEAPSKCKVADGFVLANGASESSSPNLRRGFRCAESSLEWNLRWPRILNIVTQHQADIIALQELDLDGDDSRWPEVLQAFEAAGYSGVRAKKLDRACDGVALLWCCKRLRPVGRAEAWHLHRGSVHVALAQRLQSLDGHLEFLAVTTHLKAGMTELAERERYDQFKALRRQIYCTVPCLPAMVLADLNSHCRPLQGDGGQSVQPLVYDYLTSSGFRSFPREVLGNEMQFTCWGGWQGYDVSGVFDYILSYEEHLKQEHPLIHPLRVLTNPSPADVCKFSERLPNKEHPSDHIPVVVDFYLLPASPHAGAAETLPAAEEVGTCTDVAGDACAAADAEDVAPPKEGLPGLEAAMKLASLEAHLAKAAQWCKAMGALNLEEISEDEVFNNLVRELELRPLEIRRLAKAFAIAKSADGAAGGASPQGAASGFAVNSGAEASAVNAEACLAGSAPVVVDIEPEPLEDLVELLVPVPKQILGRVIGKQAQVIKGIRNRSGASNIETLDQSVDPCQVKVRGSGKEVERARDMILEIVKGAASSNGAAPAVTKSSSSSATASPAGTAAYGGEQAAAHGVPRHYKTAMCKYFQQNLCPKGDSCSFAHGFEELRQMNQTNLYICNLPCHADESMLKQVFEAHGKISSMRVFTEKGFGFVKYSAQQEAESAIKHLNGLEYDPGMRLTVRFANNHHA
mmetsp:Transcript_43883/g.82372  ORF Transcript_43883/g.82372 Transcript_43883/m.82372 type:complete len:743 (+) Transcript_43883:91-2319(+)